MTKNSIENQSDKNRVKTVLQMHPYKMPHFLYEDQEHFYANILIAIKGGLAQGLVNPGLGGVLGMVLGATLASGKRYDR